MDVERYSTGNQSQLATTRQQRYNLTREAKMQSKKAKGIGKCIFANVISVSNQLRQTDLDERKERGDTSKDYPGIIQQSGFHDGFLMELWSKEGIELYNELLKKGLIAHFDGTGGLTRIDGAGIGHVIHSKLSFQPQQMFTSLEDFDDADNIHLAFVLAEHISDRQSGDHFAGFFTRIKKASDDIHGCPSQPLPPPILVNTDCAGQLQIGLLTAYRRNSNQTSTRIIWNNVVCGINWSPMVRPSSDLGKRRRRRRVYYWSVVTSSATVHSRVSGSRVQGSEGMGP